MALPKLEAEEYWVNYGNEDSDATLRCFELECAPDFDLLPPFSAAAPSSTPSLISLLALAVLSFTLNLHLLFG